MSEKVISSVLFLVISGVFVVSFAAYGSKSVQDQTEKKATEVLLPTLELGATSERQWSTDATRTSVISAPYSDLETLDRSLSRLPGIQPVPGSIPGGTGTLHYVRGQDPIQSRWFLEGIPLSDVRMTAANYLVPSMELLKSVEVHASRVPWELSSDGLGGAFVARVPALSSAFPPKLGLQGGSFGYRRGYLSLRTHLTALVQLEASQSIENFPYQISDLQSVSATREREHNGYYRLGVLPVLFLIQKPDHELRILNWTAYRKSQIPGPTYLPMRADYEEKLSAVEIRYRLIKRPFHFQIQNYFRWNHEKFNQSSVGLGPSFESNSTRQILAGARLQFGRLADPLEIRALANPQWERYDFNSAVLPKSGASRFSCPIGVSAARKIADTWRLSVQGILHIMSSQSEPENARRGFVAAVPTVGITKHWDQGRTQAVFSLPTRLPSLREIYGAPPFQRSQPDLLPERGWKIDLGSEFSFGPFRNDLVNGVVKEVGVWGNASAVQSQNTIAWIEDSLATRRAVNLGDSQVLSEEVGLGVEFAGRISLRSSLGFVQAQNKNRIPSQNGKPLPFRPEFRSVQALEFRPGRWHFLYEWILNGPFYSDSIGMRRIQSISDHRASVVWNTENLGKFRLDLLNLLDRSWADVEALGESHREFATGVVGLPSSGRRVYLGWQYDFL